MKTSTTTLTKESTVSNKITIDRSVVEQALHKLEKLRVTIDSEWGECRTLEEIDADGVQWSEVLALRDALAEQPAEQEAVAQRWQPIETAPKGRIVLVYYKNSLGNGRTMRARYYLPETLDSDTTESGWADEGWYEESEAYEYLMPLEHDPTHWMPLPAGPDTAPQPAKPAEQEPVAWAIYDTKHGGSKSLHWPEQHSPNGDPEHFKAVPLYTAPQPAKREPLTEEEIQKLAHVYDNTAPWTLMGFARAIERAHGIGEQE